MLARPKSRDTSVYNSVNTWLNWFQLLFFGLTGCHTVVSSVYENAYMFYQMFSINTNNMLNLFVIET